MKIILMVSVILIGFATHADPMMEKPEPLVEGPTGLISNWSKRHRQNIFVKTANLEVSASAPLKTTEPLRITGFDDLNDPYTLEIKVKKQTENIFESEFILNRAGIKQTGTIVTETGLSAKMTIQPENPTLHPTTFEITIVE